MTDYPWRRSDFKSAHDDGYIYLDTAGRSVLPSKVEQVGLEALSCKAMPWCGLGGDQNEVEEVRSLVAQLIHAPSSNCIAFAPATSSAISLAARNILQSNVLGVGKTILVLEQEMGSAMYAWQDACTQSGATLKVVVTPALTRSWNEAIQSELDENVVVIAIPHVHWCDGSIIDLEQLSIYLDDKFGSHRPYLIIDATQSLGVLPFNVTTIKPSFVCASIHKWLCAPYGMSLMYVAPEFHAIWGPIDHHERSRIGSDQPSWDEVGMMDNTTGYPTLFFDGAKRFNFGGRPNPILIPTLRQALTLIVKTWTPEKIQQYLRSLTDHLVKEIQTSCPLLDCKSREERCGHIVGLRFRSWVGTMSSSVSTLGSLLKQRNVMISVRAGWLRISPYIYNTLDEMSTLAQLLSQLSLSCYPSYNTGVNGELQQDSITGVGSASAISPTDRSIDTTSAVSLMRHIIASSSTRRMKVVLTGSTGWLGQFLCEMMLANPYLCHGYYIELYALYHTTMPEWMPSSQCIQVDLKDVMGVDAMVQQLRPDVFLHVAALSSPAICHKDPATAHAVNCPISLIDAIKRHTPRCLFLFTSSDLVYDGESPPYVATDKSLSKNPETAYGESKYAFEQAVLQLQNGIIFRLSNMLGRKFAYRNAGCKFIQWVYESFLKREKVGLRCDEIRSFVDVTDVLELIHRSLLRTATMLHLGGNEVFSGIPTRVFNVGGPIGLSRLDLGALVAQAMGSKLYVTSSESTTLHIVSMETTTTATTSSAATTTTAITPSSSSSSSTSLNISMGSINTTFSQKRQPWIVNSSTNAESIIATGIKNPRDVTMDITETERVFGIVFTPPFEAIKQILKSF